MAGAFFKPRLGLWLQLQHQIVNFTNVFNCRLIRLHKCIAVNFLVPNHTIDEISNITLDIFVIIANKFIEFPEDLWVIRYNLISKAFISNADVPKGCDAVGDLI